MPLAHLVDPFKQVNLIVNEEVIHLIQCLGSGSVATATFLLPRSGSDSVNKISTKNYKNKSVSLRTQICTVKKERLSKKYEN